MFGPIRKRLTALSPALFVLAACGERAPAPDAEEMVAEETTPAVDPAIAATIRGHIAFEGTPPTPEPIDMAEEPVCAEAYGPEGPFRETVRVQDGRLANVFVYVKEGLEGAFPAPAAPAHLDQVDCHYVPHVVGVQAGQPLRVTNSDDLLHNINAKPQRNRGFNFSQPRAGMESTRTFALQEIMIPVECDVHGWMRAYIGVVEHPYFAVSGEDGTFEIANLPPGEYALEVWHERYGTQTQSVAVAAQETKEVTFTYSAALAQRAVVPLGEPLVVRWHGEDGPELVRRSELGTRTPGAGSRR